MSTFRRYLVAAILAILYAPKYVLEAGKWVLRAVAAPPMPAGLEVEQAMDAVRAAAAPTPAPAADTVQASDTVPVAAPFASRTASETDEAIVAWGRLARAYAHARLTGAAEPDLRDLDEPAEAWLRGLSRFACERVLDFDARRVADHMLGYHLIRGLPRCMTRPEWLSQPIELAPGDELYETVKADLDRDPSLVPGYRVAA